MGTKQNYIKNYCFNVQIIVVCIVVSCEKLFHAIKQVYIGQLFGFLFNGTTLFS